MCMCGLVPLAVGQSPQLSPVLVCGFLSFGIKWEEPGTGRAKMMMSLLLSWLMSFLFFWIKLLIVQRIPSSWEVLKTCIMRCLSTVIWFWVLGFFSPVSGAMEVSQPFSPNFEPRLPHGFRVWLKGATAQAEGFQFERGRKGS